MLAAHRPIAPWALTSARPASTGRWLEAARIVFDLRSTIGYPAAAG
jgi:hypothetical protein